MLGKLSEHIQADSRERMEMSGEGSLLLRCTVPAPSPPEADTATPYISYIVALAFVITCAALSVKNHRPQRSALDGTAI